MDLVLPLRGIYFDQIKSGEKTEEYRLVKDFWTKRFSKQYQRIILTRGYPKSGDNEKRIIRPWRGVSTREILHPCFGKSPVLVYVLQVA